MKKFFGWFFLILLLLGLLTYSWLEYRQYRSYQTQIHPKAETLVRIQLDGIIKSMLGNISGNLGYVRNHWKTKKGQGIFQQVKSSGLLWPANIYMYTVVGVSDTWFSSLKVKNVTAFKAFIKGLPGHWQEQENKDGLSQFASQDGRYLVMFSTSRVVLALAYHRLDQVAGKVCSDILLKKTIPVSESIFAKALKADHHHIMGSAPNMDASMQFESGTISITASYRGNLVKGTDSLRPRRFDNNSLLKIWLDADIHRLTERYAAVLNQKGIPVDTLNRYYGGYLVAEWKDNTLLQRDTVVSYSYNDNFEKTEQVMVREDTVPEFYLGMKASPHLLGYLPQRLIYQLHSGHHEDLLYTGTGLRFSDERMVNLTADFFYMYADVGRIRKAANVSYLPEFSQAIKDVEFRAQQKTDNVFMEGNITLQDPKVNSLLQLFR
ncbi:hypothetical protein SAMN05216436_10555 [bacterium A37T11]|nr:hypothetical protein SAMN05216436_10555 [bacterium A37T11]